jgi:hypothetical protein
MFEVFDGSGVYWICGFDDLIYSIKDVITGLLIECLLVVQV